MPADPDDPDDEYMSLEELLATQDPGSDPVRTCEGSRGLATPVAQAPIGNVHSMFELGICPECDQPYPMLDDGTVRTHPRGIPWTQVGN
ncbi:hypothetical protein CCUG60884_00197 [Mycobacteroides salmoniphilum]|uniref:Uncharacterized protein n=1 Tax=Mycobacteroides salmoniphilum TaxID=404941 RepID=A0A4R8SZZ4_9MYCO|nr:hypothetical protein CCUG60884_00197 [Mycobacteroides salmoniphilum]